RPIRLTDECSRRLSELHRTQGSHLRVLVEGGGSVPVSNTNSCWTTPALALPPMIALLNVPTAAGEGLHRCRLVGAASRLHRELIREGFKVVSNPQAEKGCSCILCCACWT
uniref:Deacetylase sirtuin-type domain-containing protein n=1 Tax=Macrostomum lignano TaxID=282301 RepID=A0A1I8FF66_9PLAT